MSSFWNSNLGVLQNLPPFATLEEVFVLSQFKDWPDAKGLNWLKQVLDVEMDATFICQSKIQESGLYYEQIIFEQGVIPTRPGSWHDFFNGLIWLLFPKTKRLLNQWHVADINAHGLSPRTPRRNRITHFDECGVVLAVENTDVPSLLTEHSWHEAFVERRQCWSESVFPFVFGHANLEMLLSPFIGLTGKWLPIKVDIGFKTLDKVNQFQVLDTLLCGQLQDKALFTQPKPLKPIPLLGIPGWWDANEHPTFYQNTDYFRPLR